MNRIPGFSLGEHHFVPGFPQMAWPMVEWLLDTRYRSLFDRDRWSEASILVFEAGESQLIGAMEAVGAQYQRSEGVQPAVDGAQGRARPRRAGRARRS